MSEDEATTTTTSNQQRPLLWVAGALAGLALLMTLIFLARGCTGSASGLQPPLPSPTPVPQYIPAVSEAVSFEALNADPFQYLNQRIRVTGDLAHLTLPECDHISGPGLRWALISDNLQLDARNFERVMRLVAPGTQLTVEGVWKLYNGPLGCGKGAERGAAWYLDVQRIIAPNPLYSIYGGVINIINGVPILPEGNGGAIQPAPTAEIPDEVATPTPETEATPEPTPTMDESVPGATVQPEATDAEPTTFPTATSTPGSGQATVTPPPAGSTATPTTSGTPTTATPDGPTYTPPAPLATATPGSGGPYPGGTPTLTPTIDNPYQ